MSDTPNTLTVTLPTPVEHDGGRVETLSLREPTSMEVLEAEKKLTGLTDPTTFRDFQATLLEMVTSVPNEALNKMPISIFNEAFGFLNGLIEEGTATPKTREPRLDIVLSPPVKSAGTTYDTLSLEEPTTGAVRQAERAFNGQDSASASRNYQITLVSRVAGIPYAAAGALPISVCNRAAAFCRGFIMAGRPTGAS